MHEAMLLLVIIRHVQGELGIAWFQSSKFTPNDSAKRLRFKGTFTKLKQLHHYPPGKNPTTNIQQRVAEAQSFRDSRFGFDS
jgi:hypothetical protein